MKLAIGIIAAVLLAAGGVAAGMYFSHDNETQAPPQVSTMFFPMDRFIVSVGEDGYSRYLVMDLSLSTKDPQFFSLLHNVAPLLRNVLVQHFATVTREQAKTMFTNVVTVQDALFAEFNQKLLAQGVDSKLDQVLVTNVFVQ